MYDSLMNRAMTWIHVHFQTQCIAHLTVWADKIQSALTLKMTLTVCSFSSFSFYSWQFHVQIYNSFPIIDATELTN